MQTSLTDEHVEQKRAIANRVKTIVAIALSAVIIVSFFFPYIRFVFRDTSYPLTGLQLATVRGMMVYGPQMSGLVTIPLLTRIAVIAGVVLALAGIVLLLVRKPVWAGVAYILAGVTPLVSLITTSNIQTAVTSLNISEIEIQYLWPFLCTLAFGIAGAILSLWTQGTERLAQSIFKVFSCVSVGSVAVITIYIIVSGAPALAEIGVGNFLFGTEWEASSEIFGILPMILSSIVGTIGAIIIGVPVGLLTAIFLSETANPILAKIVRPAVELLAGIPSVIYGFFGMLVIVPAIRTFPPFQGHTTGDSLLAAIIILAIMVLPTIVNVSETALRAVPVSYREASLALGATPTTPGGKIRYPLRRDPGCRPCDRRNHGGHYGGGQCAQYAAPVGLGTLPDHGHCDGDELFDRPAPSGAVCNRPGALCLHHDCQYQLYVYLQEGSADGCQLIHFIASTAAPKTLF